MPRDFPPLLQQWVEANFVYDEGRYYRRGFETQEDSPEAAGYEYFCQVSGWYRLDVEPEGPVRVNGVSHPPGPVLLKQGPVRFESDLPWTRLRAAWERGDCPSNQDPDAESSAAS